MSGNPVINYRTCPVNWTLDVLCTYFYVLRQGQFENVMKMTILCTLKIILHLQPYVGSKISYWNDIMILAKIKITKKFQKLVKNHYSGLFRVCPSVEKRLKILGERSFCRPKLRGHRSRHNSIWDLCPYPWWLSWVSTSCLHRAIARACCWAIPRKRQSASVAHEVEVLSATHGAKSVSNVDTL